MYADHQPTIGAYMRATPEGFVRGCMFAVLSIKQPITGVPAQLEELEEFDTSAPGLWGHKVDAYLWLTDKRNGVKLWGDMCYAYSAAYPPGRSVETAMLNMLRVPGLRLIKSAFVCQLMGFDVACLDSRNVKREKRNPRAFDFNKATLHPASVLKHVRRYLLETEGKAARYWDDWCTDVAQARGMTPQDVSALHLAIVPNDYVPF